MSAKLNRLTENSQTCVFTNRVHLFSPLLFNYTSVAIVVVKIICLWIGVSTQFSVHLFHAVFFHVILCYFFFLRTLFRIAAPNLLSRIIVSLVFAVYNYILFTVISSGNANIVHMLIWVWKIKIQYNTIQYNTIQCNAIQYNTMHCYAMQCNAMRCNTLHCNAILMSPCLKVCVNYLNANDEHRDTF